MDESAFEDAFFAFEPGDMLRLCSTLPDEATFAPLSVAPTPNCSVMAYDARGANHHLARFLPDEDTCRVVATQFCAEHAGTVRCIGSFATNPTFTIDSPVPARDAAGVAPAGGPEGAKVQAIAAPNAPPPETVTPANQ